jgi:hypothetical protein
VRNISKISVIFIFGFLMLGSSGVVLPEVFATAIIGNGNVILGVDDEGHLNVPSVSVPELNYNPQGPGAVGLRDGTGVFSATEAGCICEGWGIGIPGTGLVAGANNAGGGGREGGTVGMQLESFTGSNGDDSAVSVVAIPNTDNPVLKVTHDYHPSPETPFLYEVKVTIENTDETDLNSVIYRRVMDWDIAPTFFNEFVTIQGTQTTMQLVSSGDNGFLPGRPLPIGTLTITAPANADFVDNGPADHGAVFDFEVGPIMAGESVDIVTFYGVAPNETQALQALAAVKAEIFSLGQSNLGGSADNDGVQGPTFMFAFGNVGGVALVPSDPKTGGGDNQWDTRPTFGISHEDRQNQVVENGFRFNNDEYMLTDNHHTDFAEQSVEIGTVNSFSATVYADKKLKIQEFLFGIPNIGEAQLAELGVEVWYDRDGEIEDVIVVQKSEVIDADTVSVSHEKTKCLSTDTEPLCDTTTVAMTFLEPLKDKVMAIKAIDFALRDQRTFLNEGFDISGESLNPMLAKTIPSNVRNEGLLQITQVAKYSPYWTSEDGRMFEMNSFGSFTEINKSFERFQDSGSAFTRQHSAFGGILEYEQNKALNVFDSSKYVSEVPESFAYIFPETGERLTDETINEMHLQEEIAKRVLDEMDRQDRNY